MIKESAIVREIKGKHILIEADPKQGCSSCQANNVCGQGILARYFKDKTSLIEIENGDHINGNMDAKEFAVGESIFIGLEERSILKASFIVYMVPLLTVVLALLIAFAAGVKSEPAHMLTTILALAAGVLVSRYLLTLRRSGSNLEESLLPQFLQADQYLPEVAMIERASQDVSAGPSQ